MRNFRKKIQPFRENPSSFLGACRVCRVDQLIFLVQKNINNYIDTLLKSVDETDAYAVLDVLLLTDYQKIWESC